MLARAGAMADLPVAGSEHQQARDVGGLRRPATRRLVDWVSYSRYHAAAATWSSGMWVTAR